ncbi:hypothetical protein AVEN_125823-1, partial [Araneus ventricosus]
WEGILACSPVIVWNSDVDGNDNEDDVEAINSHIDDLDSYSELISGKMKRNNNMRTNVKNLLDIVTEYIRLVQKQISDTTLKYINCFLVHQVFDFIKTELMIKLLNSPNKQMLHHDKVLACKSFLVSNWLSKHRILVLPQPAYSPDLGYLTLPSVEEPMFLKCSENCLEYLAKRCL